MDYHEQIDWTIIVLTFTLMFAIGIINALIIGSAIRLVIYSVAAIASFFSRK